MSWLDRLMGRGKKKADVTAHSSMKREGSQQEQEGTATKGAESAEQMAQDERARAAEHREDQEQAP